MESINIKITEVRKQPRKGFENSQLILSFTGKNATDAVINTFVRTGILHVPTYAFDPENITITENTSIFNNDYMRNRLSQLIISNIDIPIFQLPVEYWKNINYADPNRIKHPKDKLVLEMYININNDTQELLNVTTDHSKVYADGKEISHSKCFGDYPHLLIQLRPGQQFSCRMVATLGIGKKNHIWSATSNSFRDKQGNLAMESMGQMDEYEILYKSCLFLKHELKEIKLLIGNKYKNDSVNKLNKIQINLEDYDHTLGNLINDHLQNHKKILFAGLFKPDLLKDEIRISMEAVGENPLKYFFQTIDYVIKLVDSIESQILGLGKTYISSK